MRFKDYIREVEEPTKLADFLVDKCHWLLSELGGDAAEVIDTPMYRGISSVDKAIKVPLIVAGHRVDGYIKTVRKERAPLDSNAEVSDVINDSFNDVFGWKPRSQGMFCTGWQSNAEDYGYVYQVFPIGKFRYLWSPKVVDLIGPINSTMRRLKMDKNADKFTSDQLADFYEIIDETIATYVETGLHTAISTGREIMIGCDSYLAIPLQRK